MTLFLFIAALMAISFWLSFFLVFMFVGFTLFGHHGIIKDCGGIGVLGSHIFGFLGVCIMLTLAVALVQKALTVV